MKRLIALIVLLVFLFMPVDVFAVTYANVGPTTNFDGDVGVPTGKAYYINGVLLSIDDITTEDLIVKADFKDEDWGDLSISTNEVTIDEDVIDKANFADENWGELTVATNTVTLNDDVVGIEHFQHGVDMGEVKVNAGGTELEVDDGIIDKLNLKASTDFGEISTDISSDVTVDDGIIDKANFMASQDWGEVSTSAEGNVEIDEDIIGAEHLATQDWGDVNINAGEAEVQDLTITDEAQGDILYRGAAGWVRLAKDIGKYLKSGDTPSWDVPAGTGDMAKSTYDIDGDGDIDVAAGGTEKSIWTQYAIPYLSDTTVFGEIPIGAAEYALTVNAGATGYDFTEMPTDTNLTEEEVEDFVGTMVTGNTEDGIEVTYVDGGEGAGILNFEVTVNHVEHFMDLHAANTTYCHVAEVGSGESKDVPVTVNPDVPRNVSITTTEVAAPTGTVIVHGVLAADGAATTEDIVITAGTTVYGVKAFATVSKYVIPASVTAADTVALGISDKIGLANSISAEADIYKKTVDGVDESDEISTKGNADNNTLDCAPVVANEDITIWYQ